MTDESKTYLTRAFDRLREESVVALQQSRNRILSQMAGKGMLQSGNTLLSIKAECVRLVGESANKMSRHAFDATGTNAEDIAKVIQKSLTALRDSVANDLADFFSKGGAWAGNLSQSLGNDFLKDTDKIILGVVDDFRHGMLEGTRLTKDPLVSVISSITNSPGAVMQAGVGNVQRTLLTGGADVLCSALAVFLKSKEVQSLSPDHKQSVADVADVLSTELSKPNPDPSKLARWGARLSELAEKLGIAVAASGVSKALFG